MSWQVNLVETVTGQVGRTLSPESGSWAIELNKADSGSVRVSKDDVADIDRRRLSPWWASVLFSYITPDGRIIPICGGPIISWPSEDQDSLTLDWRGMREMFTRRHLEKDYTLRGMSLGTIAWEVVKAGMDRPAGGLPIVHGSPYESKSTLNERTYEAWNLANNNCEKRLTELTNVINGPDMMFRPEWADNEMTRVRWRFVHGTSWDPTIAQDTTMVWDTTAAGTHVTSPSVTSDGSKIFTRVFGTGAGEGAKTTRTQAESLALVKEGWPPLETVISDQDQAKAEPIRQKCLGELADSRRMVDQLSVTVYAAHEATPWGTWHVGDTVTVVLTDDWWSIPGGEHQMDIIKASGDLTDMVKVELQQGQWHAPTDLI